MGRFTVLQKIGEGGMGVVVAAYDPELDRKVAIKVLRRDARHSPAADSTGQRRLLREARAMARLSHPNVLTVFDVGTIGDDVYIAMEFAGGGTLREWCAAGKRAPDEVLAMYRRAGEGLAAAHRAGLVHRDFKPDNVLLGEDGRVRVSDFGLVAMGRDEGPVEQSSPADGHAVLRTETGAVLGTPAYMAPEQLDGKPAGPAADQFAFCVSLHEALYGERPFAGDTFFELVANVVSGEVRSPPAGSAVAPWLRAVLLRGIAVRAGDRFPSMDELLEALDDDPGARRRRRIRLGALGVTLAALVATAVAAWTRDPVTEVDPCSGAGGEVAVAWNGGRRDAVRTAFGRSGRPYAARSLARVEADLDRYAGELAGQRRETCEATHVRGTQSERLFDLRMRCLDRRLAELRAMTGLLGRADPEVVDHSVDAVAALTPVEACSDADALLAVVPPPEEPALRRRVDALDRDLGRVRALREGGRYADAMRGAERIAAQARELGWAPLLGEALFRLGDLAELTGDPARAEATLRAAIRTAAEGHDDGVGADAWLRLVYVVGDRQSRFDEALSLGLGAEAAVARAGGDPVRTATLHNVRGLIFSDLARLADAAAEHEQALSLRERALGADHPSVASSLHNLGDVQAAAGHEAEAIDYYERSIALKERALGPDHPELALTLGNLANALAALGRYDEARRTFDRSLRIRETTYGPDHPRVASVLDNLGEMLIEQGRPADARAYVERALAIRERHLAPDHIRIADSLANVGRIELLLGEPAAAESSFRRALDIFERSLGPDHPELAGPLCGLGELRLLDGRSREAVELLERAVAVGGSEPPPTGPRAKLLLARALWAAGSDPGRATALAHEARELFAGEGAVAVRDLASVDRWLAAHASPARISGR